MALEVSGKGEYPDRMTLLATEFHNCDDSANATIVFAADRRISRRGGPASGTAVDERRKIFRLPSLNAGIGWYGIADAPEGNTSEWLENYVQRDWSGYSLRTFAENLASELNTRVPDDLKRERESGFHIAGFNEDGVPEFWYVRNVDDDKATYFGEYRAREDFQRRDVKKLVGSTYQVYRNGDLRAHVLAWGELDASIGRLLAFPDFKKITTAEDYVEWVKFKMDVIAQAYERFCEQSIIGRPIDAFAIQRQ